MESLDGLGQAIGEPPAEGPAPLRRLYVDVSTIVRHDAQTGIQRVVRSVCRELARHDNRDVAITAVAATKWRAYSAVESALLPNHAGAPRPGPLELGPGDAFLGLDLSAHLFSRHERQLRRWRAAGAEIAVVVYDLLPLAHPQWFNPKTTRHFRRWLDVVGRRASLVLPISHSVQADLAQYLATNHAERASQIQSQILPLSGDIGRFQHEPNASPDRVTEAMRRRPSVLMVGTIEPRKGHAIALAAHRHAWANSPATAPLLIIAGKPGWQTEQLQAELRLLDLERDGAIWLDQVGDALLDQLYRACRCVLVASFGEGYCLPLHEALAYGKPVLARNLPVLRELHAPTISYFAKDDPASLGMALAQIVNASPPVATSTHSRGWENSVRIIMRGLMAAANG